MFENFDRAPTSAECAELNRIMRAWPRTRKIRFWHKLCQGSGLKRTAIRRDFAVADTSAHPNLKSLTVIGHLPSMLWVGFDLPFTVVLEMLEDTTQDTDLIRTIYGLPPVG
jgi:hypothetical protein